MADKIEGTQATGRGWIKWEGGPCPVAGGVLVEVQMRGYEGIGTDQADGFRWYHYPEPKDSDIVFYRVADTIIESPDTPDTLDAWEAEEQEVRARVERVERVERADCDLRKDTNPKDAIATKKLDMGLVPTTAIAAMALGFHEGALKYGRYNWRIAGVRASVYHAALQRHVAAWWNGETHDPDSGTHHLAKAMCCLAVLIDAELLNKVTDDRPPLAPVGELVRHVERDVANLHDRYGHIEPHQFTIEDSLNEVAQ